MSELSVHAALSTLRAGVAFSASGIGRLALAGARADSMVGTVAAEYLVGLLLFSTLLGMAAHLQLPAQLVTAALFHDGWVASNLAGFRDQAGLQVTPRRAF